jgi:hypothetical protein
VWFHAIALAGTDGTVLHVCNSHVPAEVDHVVSDWHVEFSAPEYEKQVLQEYVRLSSHLFPVPTTEPFRGAAGGSALQ